jgi:ATP-binding protein involved in chromosome partitioning
MRVSRSNLIERLRERPKRQIGRPPPPDDGLVAAIKAVIVENMSYFLCPQCGTRSDIFRHGGARHEAERLNVPFLGEVPLHMDIREKSDAGRPVVATEPDGAHAKIYRDMAAKVGDQLCDSTAGLSAPKIVLKA